MQNEIIFSHPEMFGGWPANHGLWQNEDKTAVGFMFGQKGMGTFHRIVKPYFRGFLILDHTTYKWSWMLADRNFDLTFTRNVKNPTPGQLLRFAGNYDTGGEGDEPNGCFYTCEGMDSLGEWEGPFIFPLSIQDHLTVKHSESTCRTSSNVIWQKYNTLFLSRCYRHDFGNDDVLCAKLQDGGEWRVTTVLADEHRAVMPAVVEARNGEWFCFMRRLGNGSDGWIDVCRSVDQGKTWSSPSLVLSTGKFNGNPPGATLLPDGRIVCVAGNRAQKKLHLAVLENNNWRYKTIATPTVTDFGYPQVFMTPNGLLNVVYYEGGEMNGIIKHVTLVLGEITGD